MHFIKNAWRRSESDNTLVLMEINWTDYELPNGFDWHLERFKQFMAEGAKEKGAQKLYLCAGYAENTIAFNNKMGCVQAKEINQELYEEDPNDLKLEYPI